MNSAREQEPVEQPGVLSGNACRVPQGLSYRELQLNSSLTGCPTPKLRYIFKSQLHSVPVSKDGVHTCSRDSEYPFTCGLRSRVPLYPPNNPSLQMLNLVPLSHPSGAPSAFSPIPLFSPGMNVLESSPYEPFIRGFDYVRLASITAGRWVGRCSCRDRGN